MSLSCQVLIVAITCQKGQIPPLLDSFKPINRDVGLDDEAVQVRRGGFQGGRHRGDQEDYGQQEVAHSLANAHCENKNADARINFCLFMFPKTDGNTEI